MIESHIFRYFWDLMGFDDSFKMIHSSMVHIQVGRGDLQGFNGIQWNMIGDTLRCHQTGWTITHCHGWLEGAIQKWWLRKTAMMIFFCGNKGALMMILVGILPWNMALTSIFAQGYHPQIMVVHWYFTITVVVMSYVVLSMDMHILLRWGSPMVRRDCNPQNGGNICPKWWIYMGSPNRYIHIHIHVHIQIHKHTHTHIYTSKINSWHRYIS